MALIKCPECKKKISDQCTNCPNCGYPIDKICETTETQTTNIANADKSIVNNTKRIDLKSLIKKWWFWVAVGVVIAAITTTTILLLNRDTKPKFDKEGNPVFVELTNEVYTNAKKYKGYHINIKGKVFQVMGDNGNVKGIQIWLDPDTCEQNMMIYYSNDVEVKQGDYIVCSGYIDSLTEYKNSYDATRHAPLVFSSDLRKATYIEVIAPTIAKITPENLKQEKFGYSVSIDKIEFAEKETRVYTTVTNNGKALLYFGDAVIVQSGKQYNSTDNYEAEYEQIPYEVVKGVSCSGIIVFPRISTNDFDLTVNIHSDDFDEEIDKFTFKITKDSIVEEKPKEPTTPVNTTNSSSVQTTNTNNSAIVVAKSYLDAYECATPNALKEHMKSYGYTDSQINYAINNGGLDWASDIKNVIWSYNSEAQKITVTNCIKCHKKFYGEYQICQELTCNGGVNWSYYYGYSRNDTINKLLSVGYSQTDVNAVMKEYKHGEFIDEKDFSDCIVVNGKLCNHFWNQATCLTPSKCPYCGETKGGLAECVYNAHKCTICGKDEPWSPPKISCSDWVSLKELREKAHYNVSHSKGNITISDYKMKFVLTGFSGGTNGTIYTLNYNGTTVHYRLDNDSNEIYQMVKLKYSDLVAIGVLL